jgi:hypothetical protein
MNDERGGGFGGFVLRGGVGNLGFLMRGCGSVGLFCAGRELRKLKGGGVRMNETAKMASGFVLSVLN